MIKYIVFKLCQFLSDVLPEQFSRGVSTFIFNVKYLLSRKDKRAVRNNLEIIMPEGSDVEKAAREVFQNFGRYLLEFFCIDKFSSKEFIRSNVKVSNLDILKEVLKRGKGGIILTAHLGNWELGATVMSALGFPLVIVALPHKEASVNDIFNSKRERQGSEVVSSKNAYRNCLNALRQNKLVALVGDRDFSFRGEVMDFLGKKAILPRGAAAFAEKTGAAIVPVFFTREGEDKFFLSINKPIFVEAVNDMKSKRDKIISVMKEYVVILENKIKAYPSQWLMFREFWLK